MVTSLQHFKSIANVQAQIALCLIRDRHRLAQQFKRFKLKDNAQLLAFQKDNSESKSWLNFVEKIAHSQQKVATNKQNIPAIKYDDALPVVKRRAELLELIKNNQVIIVAGETGSGKTTQIPKICLEAGQGVFGRIGCTQPRRLAARSVAERIAEELGSSLGQVVGYQVRFHDQVHASSLMKVMTDGILLAEVQNDPFLSQYDTIIIDEAHERSINIDFLLGILKKLLPRRPDLKLIITSATIDTERFSNYFDQAPVVEVSGRTFPVEIRYRPLVAYSNDDGEEFEQDIPTGIVHALAELAEEDSFADVLVFLVGERDIKEVAEVLRKQSYKNTLIVPLYARLSMAEQNKVFTTSQKRRIILSTNVAETSLTVPGIKFVIDPGLVRISRYSVRSKVQRLPIEKISQASANQRSGRCGRVSEGICIRLYDEEDFNSRAEFTPPEIHRISLASVILQMSVMKLGSVQNFPFIEPPENKSLNDGFRQLQELGALDDNRRLTDSGRQLARLPLEPRVSKMVVEGQNNGVLLEVLIIASALSIQDPRDMNESTRQAARQAHSQFEDGRSDFLFFLNLWRFYEDKRKHLTQNKLRKLCKTNFLSYLRMKEWHDLFVQLSQNLKKSGIKLGTFHPYEEQKLNPNSDKVTERLADIHSIAIHRSLMAGLLGNLAMRDDDKSYLGARNTKLFIHPSSSLFKKKPKWMLSGELVETTKLYARNNAAIDVRWIESLAKHLLKHSYTDAHWQKKSGQVGAFESISLYGLPIVNKRRCNYGPINPVEARKLFLRHGLVEGEMNSRVAFFKHNQKLIANIQHLEAKLRRPDFLIEDDVLYEFYAEKIPKEIYSQPAFESWVAKTEKSDPEQIKSLFLTESFLLKQEVGSEVSHAFPDQIQLKNSINIKLDYCFDPGKIKDGLVVKLPLASLNMVSAEDFEWLTPGLIKEKTGYLIKSLPKSLRKQFVPVPQYVDLVLKDMQQGKKVGGKEQDYLTQLVWALNRRANKKLSLADFDEVELPAHLMPFYQLFDHKKKLLAEDASLKNLKQNYLHLVEKQIQQTASKLVENKIITRWDFGNLVKQKKIQGKQGTILVYPALQCVGKNIELTILGNETLAQQQHGEAVLALIARELISKVKYLQTRLPLKKSCLCYSPYGSCQDLTQQVIDRALSQLVPSPANIRSQEEFEKTVEMLRNNWVLTAQEVTKQVEAILTAHQQVARKVKGRVNPRWLASVADIKQQLDGLITVNFVKETPEKWFKQMPRYFQAIDKRLEKIDIDPSKDQLAIRLIKPILERYENIKNEPAYLGSSNLVEIRWLIEELRVSLFAQPMKTVQPVSIKRLEKLLKDL